MAVKEKEFKCIEAAVEGGTSVINLFGGISEPTANAFITEFKLLERTSSRIQVRINSSGGSVFWGWSIFDTIYNSSVPVETLVVGVAASMATVIMAATKDCKMMEYASVMVHNPFYTSGEADANSEQIATYKAQLKTVYSGRWNMNEEEITAIMDGEANRDGTWMNAATARAKGIVTTVVPMEPEAVLAFKNLDDIMNSSAEAEDMQKAYQEVINKVDLQKIKIKDMLKDVAASLGLSPEASEASIVSKVNEVLNKNKEVLAEVAEVKKTNSRLETANLAATTELEKAQASLTELEASVTEKETELQKYRDVEAAAETARRDKIIADAVAEGRITEEVSAKWRKLLDGDTENTEGVIAGLEKKGVKVPLSAKIEPVAAGADPVPAPNASKAYIKNMNEILMEIENESRKALKIA